MGEALKDRVQARNGTGKDVATREQKHTTLGQQIQAMESQYQLAMPKGGEAAQLIRDALTCMRTTPKISECLPATVLGGLMTCAQLGLRPGVPGLGHAWLLPFWDNRDKCLKAQLVIGYQGYRELAQRSGQISTVIGRVVHEFDHFDIDYGVADNLIHKPKLDGPRGEAVGYYSIVKYTSGGYAFWHMSKAEVEEHRDKHATAKTKDGKIVGPWRDNPDEMAVKTTFLRLAKWMPKSTELASAIAADGTVRVDLTPNPDSLHHGQRVDAVDGEVIADDVDDSHDAGHGQMVAWSADCPDCAEDKAGEEHYRAHTEPEESCWYCQREAGWRGAGA